MTDAATTHIGSLLLEPKETYSVRDAAEILCMQLRYGKIRRRNPPLLVSGF